MQAHEGSIFVLFAVYGTVCLLYIGYVGASLGTCRCTSFSSRCLLVCFFHTLCFSETSFSVESVSKCSLNGQT